jgi:hypothetical protein
MLSTNWASGKAALFDRLIGQIKAQIAVGKGPDARCTKSLRATP